MRFLLGKFRNDHETLQTSERFNCLKLPLLGLDYAFITIHSFPRDRTKEIYKPVAIRLLQVSIRPWPQKGTLTKYDKIAIIRIVLQENIAQGTYNETLISAKTKYHQMMIFAHACNFLLKRYFRRVNT